MDYGKMTSGEFDELLAEIMDEGKASDLLSITGVYEAVSEHFNNDVLSLWEQRREEEVSDELADRPHP